MKNSVAIFSCQSLLLGTNVPNDYIWSCPGLGWLCRVICDSAHWRSCIDGVIHGTPRSFCSEVGQSNVFEFLARLNNVYVALAFLPRCITLHFVVLKFKSQSFDQLKMWFKSCCRVSESHGFCMILESFKSSANISNVLYKPSVISLTYNINNRGPSTYPCGTPLVT